MSLTPQKLTPFSISLLTTPALVLKRGQKAKETLAYKGRLRNKIDLSKSAIPPFAIDYDFGFVVDRQNKLPQAFFLRGGAEKFKLNGF